MYTELVIFTVFAFLYSLVAHRLERLPISGPAIFLVFGFLIGPFGFDLFQATPDIKAVRLLADLTLAIFLFVDAAKTRPRVLDKNYQLPMRMLLIGLPGTILLGFLTAFLFAEWLSLYEMALLAVMLAATDAALGKPVVTNTNIPERLRTGLTVESGLNDGLCVPLLLFFIALASLGPAESQGFGFAIRLILHELGIGLVVGVAIALSGSWLLNKAGKWGWISGPWVMVPTIMLALSCFCLAQVLGGSGYISAFVGGFAFRNETGPYRKELLEQAEGVGEILAMGTWVVVGIFVIGQTFSLISWPMVLYAILSLTVVRMIPI